MVRVMYNNNFLIYKYIFLAIQIKLISGEDSEILLV